MNKPEQEERSRRILGGPVRLMRKTFLQAICQILILLTALFLISIQILQFMGYTAGSLPASQIVIDSPGGSEHLSEADHEIPISPSTRERIVSSLDKKPRLPDGFFAVLFLLIALSQVLSLFPWEKDPEKVRILINTVLYLCCGLVFLFMGYSEQSVAVMNILFSAVLMEESVYVLIKKPSPGRVAVRILLLVLTLLNLIFYLNVPWFVLIMVLLRALGRILSISFSQMRIDILRKIIRKTYASEILLGMTLLMITFSVLLTVVEPGMQNIGDALWYCFVIVTTIGLGDLTAATVPGRILSVILGLFGIIVVALITSIIVNFYNEMKSESEQIHS